MKHDVYGIGNALVDVQSQVSDETLVQTGFEKGIMTLVDNDKQQALLGQLDADSFNRCAGGSAANTIVGIAEFGGQAAYVGKVGNDSMGEFFLDDMRGLGISIEATPAAEDPTGTCAILITPDAQRTMLTNLGDSAISRVIYSVVRKPAQPLTGPSSWRKNMASRSPSRPPTPSW